MSTAIPEQPGVFDIYEDRYVDKVEWCVIEDVDHTDNDRKFTTLEDALWYVLMQGGQVRQIRRDKVAE